jgi:hypothetical protein
VRPRKKRSLLHRLYLSHLALLAIITFVVGLAVLIVANLPNSVLSQGWIKVLPAKDIGSAFLSTAIIIVAFEYFYREEAELRAEERSRKLLPDQTAAVMSDLYRRLDADDGLVYSALSTETIDRIVTNSLAQRLGEVDLAREVYADLRNQVIASPQRWRDVLISINLTRYAKAPRTGSGSMLKAIFRCEYRALVEVDNFRFTCVSDLAEYRKLLRDPRSTFEWYFEPIGGLGAESSEVFTLMQFSINGEPQRINRTKRASSQTFVVDTPRRLSGEQAHITYTYSVLVQRNSHLLNIDVAQPARGHRVELNYGGCGIRFVNVLDFIASASEPRILYTPAPSVSVAFDGWVFPKSGVAFVWVLDEELETDITRTDPR